MIFFNRQMTARTKRQPITARPLSSAKFDTASYVGFLFMFFLQTLIFETKLLIFRLKLGKLLLERRYLLFLNRRYRKAFNNIRDISHDDCVSPSVITQT